MGIPKRKVCQQYNSLFAFTSAIMIFALLMCVAVAMAKDQAWEDYKLEYNKHYTAEEEPIRYANWQKEVAEVELHNAMYGEDFTQAVNEMSDLSEEEYDQIYLQGLRVPEESDAELWTPSNEPVPNSVDWRSQGLVTPVKNQGQCGSCYSFSATGALEGAVKKAKGNQSSWRYLRDAGGDESESGYPYTARQGRCNFNKGKVVATVKSYHDTQPGSEEALTQALAQVGPVSVAIDASASTFRRYRRGVHYSRSCSSSRLNHAVLAVGFGSEGGRDYFLVKNSWGTRWGAGGYIKMARNMGNNCGIASKPSFPIV